MAQSESDTLSHELSTALTDASLTGSGSTRHLRLENSDLPSLIPAQALLKVKDTKFDALKMGELICVRLGGAVAIRRFVRTKMTTSQTLLLTAREGFGKKEALPKGCLLGRVESINTGNESFDPLKGEGLLVRFWGMLTEYGTHKPFGIIPVS